MVPSITVTATEQAGLHRSVTLTQLTVSTVLLLSSHYNQKQKTQKLSLRCTHGWNALVYETSLGIYVGCNTSDAFTLLLSLLFLAFPLFMFPFNAHSLNAHFLMFLPSKVKLTSLTVSLASLNLPKSLHSSRDCQQLYFCTSLVDSKICISCTSLIHGETCFLYL